MRHINPLPIRVIAWFVKNQRGRLSPGDINLRPIVPRKFTNWAGAKLRPRVSMAVGEVMFEDSRVESARRIRTRRGLTTATSLSVAIAAACDPCALALRLHRIAARKLVVREPGVRASSAASRWASIGAFWASRYE